MKPSPSPDLESHLQRFVPEGALTYACEVLRTAPLHLHIAPHRKTKRGDFRPGRTGEKHRITVNGTLNRFAFLITLLHEVAHARVWDQFGRRVKPHGPEWQAAFRTLLTQPLDAGVFPEDISKALERHITRPSASSCSDVNLLRVLGQYDAPTGETPLESLAQGAVFTFRDRVYEKGAKRRTRFLCREVTTGRPYTFHPLTAVQPKTTDEGQGPGHS